MSNPTQSNELSPIPEGSSVGPYRVERKLGVGGMAHVYYAVHEELHRPAAIKVLKPALAADEINLQRFMNEARSAASLVHPNIVQVYDVGRDGDVRYIAQEYVAGVNLAQYLTKEDVNSNSDQGESPPQSSRGNKSSKHNSDRELPLAETLSILLQVLAALRKSESSQIVHRDIKPENIMLTVDGDVKVADFGLARSHIGDDPKLTRAGTTLGTPMYMSPEQIQGEDVDIRSDLYSLGVTLFHMLAGIPPFIAETPLALAMLHTQASVPNLQELRPDLPASLVEFVNRLLRKSKEERFLSVGDAVNFLQKHRSSDLNAWWPEHSVPLPQATPGKSFASIQATAALQAAIGGRKAKRAVWTLSRATTLALLALIAFIAGGSASFRLPVEKSRLHYGVPRKDNAKLQYEFALLHDDDLRATRIQKWRAVEIYHDDDQPLNKSYVQLARLQLARALHRKLESDEAIEKLDQVIKQADDERVKIHALVEKAIVVEDTREDSQSEVTALIEDARARLRAEITAPEERKEFGKQLDSILKWTERTREAWEAARP